MRFIKDLLFFEVQATGPDTDKDNIIQLSAVLLDKDNLLEKANFNSYVRVSYLDSMITSHAQMLGISYEAMKKSPKVYEVVKKFRDKFGLDIMLGAHAMSAVFFLKNAFKKASVPFEYDLHVIDLWALGYIYTLNYGLRKMPTFNTFVDYFKLKQSFPNDAMEKVRLQAEIFRRIVKEA